jgi:hypothetical protein
MADGAALGTLTVRMISRIEIPPFAPTLATSTINQQQGKKVLRRREDPALIATVI